MKQITSIVALEPGYYLAGGRLMKAEPGDVLTLHVSPVFGRRDISPQAALQMLASERAAEHEFGAEEMGAETEWADRDADDRVGRCG